MKKSTIIVIALVAILAIWGVSAYNGLVKMDEGVNTAWSNVENQYQRRADLIPNLVNTVKGYAEHEQQTLQDVVEARSKATSIRIDASTATPDEMEAWMAAQEEVGSALGRLIAISESYPQLRANENFLDLQTQLEGTENRIKTERDHYNEAVKEFNVKIRRFPTNILASMFGFERREMFEAKEGAEIAPEVKF